MLSKTVYGRCSLLAQITKIIMFVDKKEKKLRISISPDYAVLKGLYCSNLSVVCCLEAKQRLKKTEVDSIAAKECS